MTLTINPSDYAQLLAKYQPKVIETEVENDRAIELAQELEHKANRSNEEDAILELLVTLIEKFEDENYPIPEGTPHSMLLHLMESSNIKHIWISVLAFESRQFSAGMTILRLFTGSSLLIIENLDFCNILKI